MRLLESIDDILLRRFFHLPLHEVFTDRPIEDLRILGQIPDGRIECGEIDRGQIEPVNRHFSSFCREESGCEFHDRRLPSSGRPDERIPLPCFKCMGKVFEDRGILYIREIHVFHPNLTLPVFKCLTREKIDGFRCILDLVPELFDRDDLIREVHIELRHIEKESGKHSGEGCEQNQVRQRDSIIQIGVTEYPIKRDKNDE